MCTTENVTSPRESPVCLCETTGCFPDPNNQYLYEYCYARHTRPIPFTCSQESNQVLDPEYCVCTESECPSCGWLPTDSSECPRYTSQMLESL